MNLISPSVVLARLDFSCPLGAAGASGPVNEDRSRALFSSSR